MVILYKDPNGEKIFDRGQSQGTLNLTAADEARIERFDDLEKHCLDIESRLAKYEVSSYKNMILVQSIADMIVTLMPRLLNVYFKFSDCYTF